MTAAHDADAAADAAPATVTMVAILRVDDGTTLVATACGQLLKTLWTGPPGTSPGESYFCRKGIDVYGRPSMIFERDATAARMFDEAGHA